MVVTCMPNTLVALRPSPFRGDVLGKRCVQTPAWCMPSVWMNGATARSSPRLHLDMRRIEYLLRISPSSHVHLQRNNRGGSACVCRASGGHIAAGRVVDTYALVRNTSRSYAVAKGIAIGEGG